MTHPNCIYFNTSISLSKWMSTISFDNHMFSCKDPSRRLPFFAHLQFFQSPLSNPVLPLYAKAQASVMVDMQSLPLIELFHNLLMILVFSPLLMKKLRFRILDSWVNVNYCGSLFVSHYYFLWGVMN